MIKDIIDKSRITIWSLTALVGYLSITGVLTEPSIKELVLYLLLFSVGGEQVVSRLLDKWVGPPVCVENHNKNVTEEKSLKIP